VALIGIYSDVHISRSSSILPLYLNETDIYTTRLQMCSDSINFANNLFKEKNVNLIVNCGDTFNSHTVTADELSTYVNTVKNKPKGLVEELTLVGNHDKFNNTFDSMCISSIPAISSYYYYELYDYDCYLIGYYDTQEFYKVIEEMLEKEPKRHKKSILFMHGDINGSYLSGIKRIEGQIGKEYLLDNFDIIFNGHIHCNEVLYDKDNKKIINIGSLTSHSFADSNYHIGACYIFDTDKLLLQQYVNPCQIMFRTIQINNISDIKKIQKEDDKAHELLGNTDKSIQQRYEKNLIIKIKCPYSLKEEIEKQLIQCSQILKYKLIFEYDVELKKETSNNNQSIQTYNIEDDFLSFLSQQDLKNSIEEYEKLIQESINLK